MQKHFQKLILLASLAGATVYSAYAQRVLFDHHIGMTVESKSFPHHRLSSAFSPDTVRVLAAMIDFRPDDDDRTSGTGQFDLSAAKRIIDSPPRNKQYFEQHLTFVENYFRKVSDGKLIVAGDVLDSVYHLLNPMSVYSPPRGSTTNAELGKLMTDAWRLVDAKTPGIHYEKYNTFVIFHAGAGHDIDFVSIYGYDPTPFDLPSLYIDSTALKKIYGSDYQGISLRNGSYHLTNSIILPETENRDIVGVTGKFLLQLGTNGLFAASIGSRLGLPDLFDTNDGSSGIGRFGLMDGQSIFSWNGVFPPEPSAWEKYYLGWVNPITIASGSGSYSFPAVGLNSSPDSIYRVLISDKEYFLVENRNRDAHADSAVVWMTTNTGTIRRAWAIDTIGFSFFSQDSLYGVITDVDEFDWSLPGYATSSSPGGGLLIWHIDENIIEAGLATNSVNADRKHKGVNLMEADGSQDIGQSYSILQSGSGSENGTQLDYWYRGNEATARILSNAFTPASFPSSESNNGANSHISFKGFSVTSPRMTATIQVGDTIVAPLSGFPKPVEGSAANHSLKVASLNGNPSLLLALPGTLYGWHVDGGPILNTFPADGIIARYLYGNGSIDPLGDVVAGDFNHDGVSDLAFPVRKSSTIVPTAYAIDAYSVIDNDANGRIDQLFSTPVGQVFSPLSSTDSSFVWGDSATFHVLRLSDDSVMTFSGSPASPSERVVGVTPLNKISPFSFVSVTSGGVLSITTPGIITIVPNPSKQFAGTMVAPAIVGYPNSAKGKRIMFVSKEGMLYAVDSLLNAIQGFPVRLNGEVANSPAYADIDGDGERDIVVFAGNRIYAVNSTGAILSNFPVTVPSENAILSAPVIADLQGDGGVEIIAVTQEGLVVAYDKAGRMADGFPLLSGKNSGSTPVLFLLSPCIHCGFSICLAVAADDGQVYGWKTGTAPSPADAPIWVAPWPQKMRDAQNSGLEDVYLPANTVAKEFFPASSAYNWPNPVGPEQNYRTHIRYFLGQSASVAIKIYDLAGALVKQIDTRGTGGMDNEVEWDVSGVQSGVYFAHIEAQGTTDHAVTIIKIAVIK